ncbi:DNA-binding response regulator [Polynucleobacter aenigmaticus]|uniref:DNA-binding response regulator n=1 Tax=Polynucleobacter aenigmaticus TaxID=1743164 RepID=A0A254Q0Z4_9BURK|nr:DNA-binding response regulator [Polynucleobacter aenigmaticus]
MKKIQILVVDDHTLFRRGLIALLSQASDFEVVGEAGDAIEALRLCATLKPDVILLDNHLPGASGIQSLPDIFHASPDSTVIMLTVSEDEEDLIRALQNGAQGYLLKTSEKDDLLFGIRKAFDGESVISKEMTHKLVSAFKSNAKKDEKSKATSLASSLSPRELDAVRLIATGASNKEIARQLGIAETTVKIHVQHILRKLNLSSRVQVAVFASAEGIGL